MIGWNKNQEQTQSLPEGTGAGANVAEGISEGEGGNSVGEGGIEDVDSLHSTGSIPEAKQYCFVGSSNLRKRDNQWNCWLMDWEPT